MPMWLYALVVIAFLIAVLMVGKFWPETFTNLFGPKTLSDGRKTARIGKVVSSCWIGLGALAIVVAAFGVVTFLTRDDIAGALAMLPLAIFFGLQIPYYLKTLSTDFHNVDWDEDKISGPSEIRAFGWQGRRTTIATSDIKREGHSFWFIYFDWFYYIESVDGRRIYWTDKHFGREYLELHIKSVLPDQPKRNLFRRLAKF